MQYSYFPVRLDQMGARISFTELVEGAFEIDDISVQTRYLNHTALTLGFRVEADGAALVYASDHEPYETTLASGTEPLSGRDPDHANFARAQTSSSMMLNSPTPNTAVAWDGDIAHSNTR